MMKLRMIFGIISCFFSLTFLSGCGEDAKEKSAPPSSSAFPLIEGKKLADTWELKEIGRANSKLSGVSLPLLEGWEEFDKDNAVPGQIILSNHSRGYEAELCEWEDSYYAKQDLLPLASVYIERVQKANSDLKILEELCDCVVGNKIPAKRCKFSISQGKSKWMIHFFKTKTGYATLEQGAGAESDFERAIPVFEAIAKGIRL